MKELFDPLANCVHRHLSGWPEKDPTSISLHSQWNFPFLVKGFIHRNKLFNFPFQPSISEYIELSNGFKFDFYQDLAVCFDKSSDWEA